MSEHIQMTISDLKKKLQEHDDAVIRIKKTINDLCQIAGLQPLYNDAALLPSASGTLEIRSDQFHGRPLATVVREYLEMRKRANMGPSQSNDIYEALLKGGYEFGSKSEVNAKIVLSQALRKNTTFYRLPNRTIGLAEWYPNARRRRTDAEDDDDPASSAESVPGKVSNDA